MSRAPRPAGTTPAARPACEDRVPDALGRRRRHEHLEAVLAGVAGARDRDADAGDLAGREPVVLDVAEVDAGQRLQDLARRRPLDRDQRVARARVDGRRRRRRRRSALAIQSKSLTMFDGVDDQHEVVVGQPVDEHVVDEGALRASSAPEYCIWPIGEPGGVVGRDAAGPPPARRAPAISISPMWLTSKRPARVRTARCSSVMPEYSTGMSQPPNSTMRAPRERWRALSGVFLSVPESA